MGRQMVGEMSRMSKLHNNQFSEQGATSPDVNESSFRPFPGSGSDSRLEDQWSEDDSEESLKSDASDDDVKAFPCCLLCIKKRRHKLDDVVPDRKTVHTDESMNLLDLVEMDDHDRGNDADDNDAPDL